MSAPRYLVRHPKPQVEPGVCYGATDLPVDPALVSDCAARLRARLPAGLLVYSSPLRRCADLARALAGDAVILDARLTELDFGNWEMRPWDDIPRAEIDAWAADVAHYAPGGGESAVQMARRVAAFHAGLPAQPLLVVCHAGTIRLLSACGSGASLDAMARAAAATPNAIGYGEIVLMPGV